MGFYFPIHFRHTFSRRQQYPSKICTSQKTPRNSYTEHRQSFSVSSEICFYHYGIFYGCGSYNYGTFIVMVFIMVICFYNCGKIFEQPWTLLGFLRIRNHGCANTNIRHLRLIPTPSLVQHRAVSTFSFQSLARETQFRKTQSRSKGIWPTLTPWLNLWTSKLSGEYRVHLANIREHTNLGGQARGGQG